MLCHRFLSMALCYLIGREPEWRRKRHEREQGEVQEGCASQGQRFCAESKDARRCSAEAEEVTGITEAKGAQFMSETKFDIPDPVVQAIEEGTLPVKAFRQSSGQSQHDVAANAGMTDERLAQIEQDRRPTVSSWPYSRTC